MANQTNSPYVVTDSASGSNTSSFLRCYGALLFVTIMVAGFNSVYVVIGVVPSYAAQMIGAFTLPIYFVAWVQSDARGRRCTPFFDFGTFMMATWPVSVLWYLIWTRRWRGLLLVLMFLGLLFATTIVPFVVWVILGIAVA